MTGRELQEPCDSHRWRQFVRGWMQDPLKVGAVLPSSRLLARLMVKSLRPGLRVIELGAGTGIVTEAILQAGVRRGDLFAVEQNPRFVEILRGRFPGSMVLAGDACSLCSQLAYLAGTVDAVISGLPLLLFPNGQRRAVLQEAFALLRPGGFFQQFTYGGCCPVSRTLRRELGLRASLAGVAPFNIPPAFVYRLERA